MSIRQQIRDQIITELNTDRPTDVPECTKRRYVPGELLRAPRIAVFFRRDPARPATGRHSPLVARELFISTQCLNLVEDPADIDDSVEPFLTWITSVLGETNLDGLAHEIEEGETTWEVQYGDCIYVAATTLWRVSYQTLRNNLAAKQ